MIRSKASTEPKMILAALADRSFDSFSRLAFGCGARVGAGGASGFMPALGAS
jgi:hypothetical protein